MPTSLMLSYANLLVFQVLFFKKLKWHGYHVLLNRLNSFGKYWLKYVYIKKKKHTQNSIWTQCWRQFDSGQVTRTASIIKHYKCSKIVCISHARGLRMEQWLEWRPWGSADWWHCYYAQVQRANLLWLMWDYSLIFIWQGTCLWGVSKDI